MSHHVLKVVPPYFDALLDGSKTFEVRKNDRAFQRGDTLTLVDSNPASTHKHYDTCPCRRVERVISFVYAGDPRFGGIEPGHVVLALWTPDDTAPAHNPAEVPAEVPGDEGDAR